MCKIEKYLSDELVVCNIGVADRTDLINRLSEIIHENTGIDKQKITDSVWEREQYGTTGIGNAVAIPHGRMNGVDDIVLLIATTDNPVDYNSIDGEGVSLIFMLLVPEGNNLIYLKLLSQISIICNDKSIRTALIQAESSDEIIDILRSID